MTARSSLAAGHPTRSGEPAAAVDPTPLEGLRLTPEELAELTERIFDTTHAGQDGLEPGVPFDTCLQLFVSQQVPETVVRAALGELLERREQRLSNVLGRKADELQHLLLGLLPRLDASFHAQVRVPVPADPTRPAGAPVGVGEWVVYQIAAEKGELEVRARHESARGAERLFALLVRGARQAGWLDRLQGSRARRAGEVVVIDPPGLGLEGLLAWSLDRGGDGPAPGRVMRVAFERLREAVLAEIDRALAFVRDLDFEGDAGGRGPGR